MTAPRVEFGNRGLSGLGLVVFDGNECPEPIAIGAAVRGWRLIGFVLVGGVAAGVVVLCPARMIAPRRL